MFHSEQAPGHRLDEIFLRLKSKAKEIIRTITGNLPLIVQEAVASAIRSLTRYGLCTQDGTPAPDAPVDIMCNNGALKWDSVNQRVYADGTPEVLTVSGPNLLNPATNITGKYITAGGKISNGADAQYTDLIPVTAGETYIWSLVSNRENGGSDRCHGYNSSGNWVRQIAWQTTGKGVGLPFFLLATIPNGISYVRLSYGINDTEAMFSSSWSMAGNVAEGFFNGVYQNNICCLPSNYESETIQSPYTSALASRAPALLAEVEPGKKYYIRNTVNGEVRRSITYFASLDDVTDSNKSIFHIDAAANDIAYTAAPTGAAYVVIGFKSVKYNTTYTFGDPDVVEINAADYQPYVPPQTASVPMLLSVGDTKDEVELIAGTYTHRCAACEYDGTQDVGDTYLSTTGGKDIGAIIVYPLAEPTTESITPQELTLTERTNIIDATANVEPLTAKCKYQAVSALDILSALLGTRSGTEDMSIRDAKDVVNVILGDDNK